MVEHRHIDHTVCLGDTDALYKIPDRLRRNAASSQARKGGHTRVIPSADVPIAHQHSQRAFGQYSVSEVEPREFILMRPRRYIYVGNKPIIKRAMVLKL